MRILSVAYLSVDCFRRSDNGAPGMSSIPDTRAEPLLIL